MVAATQGLRVLREEVFAGAMARSVFLSEPHVFPDTVKTEPIGLQRLFVTAHGREEGG